ncbi:MAG TPA: HEAT repeat domain-containing protein, partial [Polyangiaceae bacterium]
SYVAARGPSGAVEVTKEKQAYHADDRGKALGIAVELLLGKAAANPNAERRWLDAASGAEQVRVRAQGSVLADLEQRYRIIRKDDAFVRPDPNVTADSLDFQDAFAMTTTVDAPTDPTIPGLTLDAAMKRFSDIYQKAKNGDAYAAALFLAEWLKGGPGRAEKLLAILKGGQVPEALRPALFLALQRCDTPEARGVLQKALTDKALPEMDRARAASALSDIPHPTPESAHALVQASGESETKLVAGTSVRALGHLAERGAALGPELQGELRDTLREDLKGAKTTSRAVDVVDAIGNTGDKSLLPDVAQHLSDDSMALREHSARALRNMPVADATALIVPRLQTETDPGVRTALVDTGAALGIRDPNALALAASELATEPSPTVRASLIRWLGAEVDVPTAKAALIAQFHREQVPQLLQLIGHYVSADDLR